MTKDQVEVITSVERRRRKIRHSMRSFELLPLLRPLELRQVALIAYPEDEFTSVPRAIRHSHGRWCPGEGQPDQVRSIVYAVPLAGSVPLNPISYF